MPFKFINLNIWNSGILLDNALEFIRQENPDILALQEVCNGSDKNLPKGLASLSIIKNSINIPYCAFSPAFFEMHDRVKVESGNAVFSKFPILDESTIFYDIPYSERLIDSTDHAHTSRNLQHVRIEIKGKKLDIFNTHGIWGEDGKDNERRMAMCKMIAENVKNEKNVILSGDFNVDCNTRSISRIERYLTNVFKNKIKTSFNMNIKKNPSFAASVVDMIFVSREIKIANSSCPPVNVSDHLPLVMVFDF